MLKFYDFSSIRKTSVCAGIFALSQVFFSNAIGQQFTTGRLVVERVGNGAPQTSSATPTFLDEYTTAGVPGISIALPTVTVPPVNRTVESGVASSDGMITRSVDGNYIVVPGYDAALGTTNLVTQNAPKVITRVDADGNLASTVVTDASAFSGSNFRSVVTTDGSEYWMSGAGNGAVYMLHQGNTVPAPGTEISSTITDNRNILIYNSQLYQGSASTPATGIYNVGSGLPTVPGNTMTVDASLGASGDPYGFVIVKNGTIPVMYIADANNKLIRKFFQVGSSWFAAGSVSVTVGGTATSFYGITGNVVAGIVHLYATTCDVIGTNSRVVAFSDATSGSTVITGSIVGTTIVGPTSNTAIRGIAFVPFSVAGISPTVPSVCYGTGTTLTITGNPNTSVTYQVNGVTQPAVTISGTGAATISTGPLTSNTTYTVISATDGNITQTYSYLATVSVNPLPTVTVSAGGIVCPGVTVGLLASGAVTYSWAPTAGLSDSVGNSVGATPASTTTYTITGTDGNGCMNTAKVTVSINPLPVISTGTAVAICNGGSTNLAVSGGVSYTWAPATGLSATTGGHVTANPTSTTSYTITGTGGDGCVNTIVNTVTVNPLPTVGLPSAPSICAGSSTGLTASGAVSYLWGPSTGLFPLVGDNVTADPTTTTTYTVTGTDINGCKNTDTVTVFVNPLPVISAGANTDICYGFSTGLTATGGVMYTWLPATGLSSTAGSSVTAGPATTTIYTVTGTDGNGCMNTGRVTVNVHSQPIVSASPNTAICIGASTGLSAVGAISYTWMPATGLTATTGNSISTTPTTTTTYTVTGTNSSGCTSTTTVTVTVNNLPVISAGPNVAICTGSLTTLTATGATTYTWAPGFGLSVTTGSTVIAHPTATTTYTITGINGCISSGTITVSVNPLPTVTSTGATICSGSSAGLTASGAASYIWTPATALSATTGNSVTSNPTANTVYTITGTDVNGCVNVSHATVYVNLIPVITAGTGAIICDGASASLSATGASTYTWSPGTGLSNTVGASVSASPSSTTTYTITGTSPYGCVGSNRVTVSVNPLPTIYSVTGGGTFCAGGIGFPVGLSGSQGGITYYMYGNSLYTGISRTGIGSALDFGHPNTAGFYTITAVDPATSCSDTMSGGAGIVINHGPVAVAVTGGGSFCPGAPGVHVGLGGSVNGTTYQLYLDSVAIDTAVAGSGAPIDFGLQTGLGTYTATATTAGNPCVTNMAGSATISTLPVPPVFTVTGGGVYCQGGTGVHIGLIGSQIGDHYSIYVDGASAATSLIGMNAPLDFGLFTTPGVYTVVSYSSTTGCNDTMTGTATVSINPTPAITGASMIPHNDTTTLFATPAGGAWTSQYPLIAPVSSSGVVTGLELGASTITYTLPTGCMETHYITISFNVGTPAVNAESDITLAPNPNNGIFTLKGSFADPSYTEAAIEITNLLGQTVYNRNITIQNGEINEQVALNNMPPGVYMLSLKAGAEVKALRFVKEQ